MDGFQALGARPGVGGLIQDRARRNQREASDTTKVIVHVSLTEIGPKARWPGLRPK